MDTRITLVDTPTGVPASVRTVLNFSDAITMLSSTDLYDASSGKVAYSVDNYKSFASSKTVIKDVRGGKDEILATISKNDVLPDSVTFPAREGVRGKEVKVKIEKWMWAPKHRDFPMSFEINGQEYQWIVGAGRTLQLIDPKQADAPLAWHEPSPDGPKKGGRLLLTPAAETDVMHDDVIVSCIMALQRWAASIRFAQFGSAVAAEQMYSNTFGRDA